MNQLPKSSRKSKGFTLPELLVAMSITLVLVLLTLSITGTAMDAWRGARTEIRAAGQAKLILNALGRDLESMVSRTGNAQTQWLVATTNPSNLGPQAAPSPNASRLTFFTRATDRYDGNAGSRERLGGGNTNNRNADLGGDISAVSYELDFVDPVWGSTNPTFATFVFYRNLMEPVETYQQKVIGAPNLEQAFENSAGPNDLADLICENVYELTVTFVVRYRDASNNVITERLPVMSAGGGNNIQQSFAITGTGLAPNMRQGSVLAGGRIVSVELAITVLSDEGISIMKRIPFRSPVEKRQFLEKHSYRYSRSVVIPQG